MHWLIYHFVLLIFLSSFKHLSVPLWIVGADLNVLLDERHSPPKGLPLNDDNAYSLGRIGKHNLDVTVLTSGDMRSDAASVVTEMLRIFTEARTVLMVGIDSGMTSGNNDIRFGDVVVSATHPNSSVTNNTSPELPTYTIAKCPINCSEWTLGEV
jgi:hypothetical protein